MALRWLDSFDAYATAHLATRYASATNAAIMTNSGRNGRGALRPAAGDEVWLACQTPLTVISGCACQLTVLPAVDGPLSRVYLGSTPQVTLGVTSTGAVFVALGTSTVLATSNAGLLVPGTYAFITWKIFPDPIAGLFTVTIDGTQVLARSGINTAGAGSAGSDFVTLCGGAAGSQLFDDWYVLDSSGPAPLNDVLPSVRIDPSRVSGAGAWANWTPSRTAATWPCVDDAIPNDDEDYATTTSVGARDTFPVAPPAVPGATIYGAQLTLVARRLVPDANAFTPQVAPILRQGAVDTIGTPFSPLTGTYGSAASRYAAPADGQAWFSTLQIGFTRTR